MLDVTVLYELLIAQTLSLLATNTVVCYSLTVGFYLGAMGLGAWLWQKIFPRASAGQSLFRIEVGLSVLGCLSVMTIYLAHMMFGYVWFRFHYGLATVLFFTAVFLLVVASLAVSGGRPDRPPVADAPSQPTLRLARAPVRSGSCAP